MKMKTAIWNEFVDNAMLYKDITQWLRNKTFLILFIGLLAVAEVITAFVVFLPRSSDAVGNVSFGILSAVLFIYTMIIAFLGHNLTAREFVNRTFELYELSGMSLERMVWGKILSMLVQFLFGFFCIVPFMFVSFILGGLDFYLVLTIVIILLLAISPLYLVALFVALMGKIKQVSAFLRGIILVFMFIFAPWMALAVLAEHIFGHGGSFELGEYFKELFVLKKDAVIAASVFLCFYAQICLLLFYLCCNAISPSADSRATAVKFLCFLLGVSWLSFALIMNWGGAYSDEDGYVILAPLMVLFLLIGVSSFYSRLDVPIMTVRRRQKTRFPGARLVYYFFHPGALGAFRTLLLFYAAFLLFWQTAEFVNKSGLPSEFLEAVATALQLPFFLAVPAAILVRIRKFSRNMTALRAVSIISWVLLGIPLMILVLIDRADSRAFGTATSWVVKVLGLVISPLSSVFVDSDALYFSRIALGVLGFYMMYGMIRHRRKQEAGLEPIHAGE